MQFPQTDRQTMEALMFPTVCSFISFKAFVRLDPIRQPLATAARRSAI